MDKQTNNQSHPLVENVDYTIENGSYVFTEKYLRERGYCCKNGCRHCPYEFQKSG
ncbi:MAG: DUF5522 domain-containing protein [Pseudohongiellaceae bacterium]